MIPKDLAEQVRTEGRRLKEEQERFLQIYKQLCIHCGGPEWQKAQIEVVFHHVRSEVIPILEQVGMDDKSVQALCSWAEKLLLQR
jgi:hypothetical protein